MIRFTNSSGFVRPVIAQNATTTERKAATQLANALNGLVYNDSNYRHYKTFLEGTHNVLKQTIPKYQYYVDEQTVQQIENFYKSVKGITPWDPNQQGTTPEAFDFNFYGGLVPDKVQTYNDAKQSVSFGGRKVADIDIIGQYPDLNSYLHADYTFVGAPAGLPGKAKQFTEYNETLRPLTDQERQILRETLLGRTEEKPASLADLAADSFVDKQSERTFGALSADVLKQTLNEYNKALKQEQFTGVLQGMGLPDINLFKQDIKNSLLGDIKAGGFLNLSAKNKTGNGLSESIDKSLGIGSSVSYNWQKWFDETLAKRYENMQEIKDPADATTTYKLEKEFANTFINDYLKPRFDTSKSINEFVNYIDVREDEQNVLQTQLASSALKEFANKQAKTYIDSLGSQTVSKGFDPKFYWAPELITGTQDPVKQNLYEQQKNSIQTNWDERNDPKKIKDNKSWNELAYEYGIDINNQEDFARLHYEILGKSSGYDPVADTYNRRDLANFIQGDLTRALEAEKASFGNPTFLKFVSAESKASELVDKLNIANLPSELKNNLKTLGVDGQTDPVETVKEALIQILSTDPALKMREQIRQLNEQNIKPTQEYLGYGYIQRDADEEIKSEAGGSSLYGIFKNAGYSGNENEFYSEFFPDATEEEKKLTYMTKQGTTLKGMKGVMGFGMPDFSDPFAAIGSLSSMMEVDDTNEKETYTPKRSTYFDYFEDEKDEGAPSYFNMGTGSGFGSLFG